MKTGILFHLAHCFAMPFFAATLNELYMLGRRLTGHSSLSGWETNFLL
jgi:hypothetical protein